MTPLPDPNKKPHEVFSLGKLNAGEVADPRGAQLPENTDVIVEYVYENEQAVRRAAATRSRTRGS